MNCTPFIILLFHCLCNAVFQIKPPRPSHSVSENMTTSRRDSDVTRNIHAAFPSPHSVSVITASLHCARAHGHSVRWYGKCSLIKRNCELCESFSYIIPTCIFQYVTLYTRCPQTNDLIPESAVAPMTERIDVVIRLPGDWISVPYPMTQYSTAGYHISPRLPAIFMCYNMCYSYDMCVDEFVQSIETPATLWCINTAYTKKYDATVQCKSIIFMYYFIRLSIKGKNDECGNIPCTCKGYIINLRGNNIRMSVLYTGDPLYNQIYQIFSQVYRLRFKALSIYYGNGPSHMCDLFSPCLYILQIFQWGTPTGHWCYGNMRPCGDQSVWICGYHINRWGENPNRHKIYKVRSPSVSAYICLRNIICPVLSEPMALQPFYVIVYMYKQSNEISCGKSHFISDSFCMPLMALTANCKVSVYMQNNEIIRGKTHPICDSSSVSFKILQYDLIYVNLKLAVMDIIVCLYGRRYLLETSSKIEVYIYILPECGTIYYLPVRNAHLLCIYVLTYPYQFLYFMWMMINPKTEGVNDKIHMAEPANTMQACGYNPTGPSITSNPRPTSSISYCQRNTYKRRRPSTKGGLFSNHHYDAGIVDVITYARSVERCDVTHGGDTSYVRQLGFVERPEHGRCQCCHMMYLPYGGIVIGLVMSYVSCLSICVILYVGGLVEYYPEICRIHQIR